MHISGLNFNLATIFRLFIFGHAIFTFKTQCSACRQHVYYIVFYRIFSDSCRFVIILFLIFKPLGNLEILPRLRNIVNLLKYGDVQTGVFTLINILQHENDQEKLLKALLILEHLLHHGVCSPNKLQSLFVKVSDRLEKSKCDEVAYKAQKISLILAAQI